MKVVSRALAISLLASAGIVPVLADGAQDYYLQRYQQSIGFDQNQNATSYALAGSTLATMSNSGSVLANPAGLGWMKDAEVSGGYARQKTSGNDLSEENEIDAVTNAGQILASMPIMPYVDDTPEYGSIGFGWSKQKVGGNGIGAEDFDSDGYRLHLAYGIDLNPNLTVGYAISYVYTQLYLGGESQLKMNNGVLNTIGAQYKLSPDTLVGLSTGFGFGNFDPTQGGSDSNSNSNSWNIVTGISNKLTDTITGSAGFDYTNYNTDFGMDSYNWNFRTGLEKDYGMFSTRLGLRYAALFGSEIISPVGTTDNDTYMAVSFGGGFKLESGAHIDYASEYRNSGNGDWTHMVSAAIPFSLCEDI